MTRIYGAYHCSSRDDVTNEYVIDADANLTILRERVNKYFSIPSVISYYKNKLIKIENDETRSNRWYTDGGGCAYNMYIELKELPTLG